MLLAVAVMTNDFHQWAFTFPAGVIAADSNHGYGPLYFLLAFSYGAEFLAVNGVLCYTALHQRVGPSWRLVLPPGLYPRIWQLCCRLRLGPAKYLSFWPMKAMSNFSASPI